MKVEYMEKMSNRLDAIKKKTENLNGNSWKKIKLFMIGKYKPKQGIIPND